MACPGVFVQDPERYLKALDVVPPSLFRPGKKAVLDSSLRYRIGFEIYYFSTLADRAKFKKDPLRHCGILTDPVSMARFQPTARSPHTEYAARLYYFSTDSTRVKFLENPTLYKDRRTGKN